MRLITWNVQWCRGIDGVVDPARIAHEARRIADPDVLCLQEINAGFADLPGSQGEDQVEALRREFPGHFVCFAAAVDVPGNEGTRKRFGNLIA
ncbi:MAG: endonuclease, partial [Betaproteobacteria bacterium]